MERITRDNPVLEKSKSFALRIIKLYKFLRDERSEYVMSKQILRSGTSIGANARESIYAQSSADFYTKLYYSLKEASETAYWLELLYESDYIDEASYTSIYRDCTELIKILTAITKHYKFLMTGVTYVTPVRANTNSILLFLINSK